MAKEVQYSSASTSKTKSSTKESVAVLVLLLRLITIRVVASPQAAALETVALLGALESTTTVMLTGSPVETPVPTVAVIVLVPSARVTSLKSAALAVNPLAGNVVSPSVLETLNVTSALLLFAQLAEPTETLSWKPSNEVLASSSVPLSKAPSDGAMKLASQGIRIVNAMLSKQRRHPLVQH